jgi:hypothetical protein
LRDNLDYKRYAAYGDRKLAVLMFAFWLNELFVQNHIDAIALSAHPGVARSNLRNVQLITERSAWQRFQLRFYESMAIPIEKGAYSILYAGPAPDVNDGEYVGLSGPGEISGYPRISKGQKRAYDRSLRKKLWKISEELTNVKIDGGT